MVMGTSALRFTAVLACIALMDLAPVSVFAQSNELRTSTEEIIEAEKLPVVSLSTYTKELLPGDEVLGDFVVGPGKTELRLKPGESKTIELIVTNRMGDLREFTFNVEDITGSQNTEQVVVLLGDDRGPYTLKDYISLSEEEVVLNHNERARIPVTISIPEDAEAGGRYGSVLISTVTKTAEAGNTAGAAPQSALISRIGALFFVIVDGDLDVSGKLKDFTTVPSKKWFTEGPVRFGIYYENTGSVHLNPYGELRIANIFGEEVGFVQIEPWFALPDSLRFREVEWNREFLFGKYTATISINRGYDNIIDAREYVFWVLPWKIILAGFVGTFIFIFLISLFFRSFEFKRKR